MVLRGTRDIAFVLLLTALPGGFALAAGGGGARGGAVGGGAIGGSSGTLGIGAAVGGGAPAGRVGGGAPAGQVGGGALGSPTLGGNGSTGVTGGPASGLENAPTSGGVIGGDTGVPPAAPDVGGRSPPVVGQSQPDSATVPKAVEGVAEQPAPSTVGLAKPGPDGISTIIVAPRPCGVAAHETDGTTTCIGIPAGRR
jgi:hypothetical protein